MRATPEATEAFADDADLAATGYTTLGRTGLTISRLGFGARRLDGSAGQAEALHAALDRGINLVDVASGHGSARGASLVADTLAARFADGRNRREQLVLLARIGLVQGERLAELREREAEGEAFAEMVRPQDALWHSIHPDFLEEECERVLEGLRIDSLDLLLLGNPDLFLADAVQHRKGVPLAKVREQLDGRLRRAFDKLEALADEGKLGWYGISTPALAARAEDPQAIELERVLEAAEAAARSRGKDRSRLAVIELPLNLLEARAALKDDLFARAKKAGVAVLTERPLDVLAGPNRLLRLAEPPPRPQATPLAEAAAEVQAIEAIFAQDFAPKIRVQTGPPATQIFRWGHELADAPQKLSGVEHWMAMQAQVIGPQVQGLLQQLTRAFSKDASFQAWGKRYVEALNVLLASVSAELVDKLGQEAAQMKAKIASAVPEAWQSAPLARQAIATALGTEGVDAVMVGMRRSAYVDDALGAVGLPPLPAGGARKVYEAFGK